jgi:acetate kinase
MDSLLNKKSGILGITGKYTDRRDVEKDAQAGDKRCQLAIDIESYRLKKYIGAYSYAVGGSDAIVFTAGVGEMSDITRSKSLDGLESLGIVYDPGKNKIAKTRNSESDITGAGSKVKIFVIPTDEERVFIEDVVHLVDGTYDIHTNFTYRFQNPDYVNTLRSLAFAHECEKKPQLMGVVAPVAQRAFQKEAAKNPELKKLVEKIPCGS